MSDPRHQSQSPKVAIVHDFLLTLGGAERVLLELAALYPEAPLYTLLADAQLIDQYFPGRAVHVSWLQKLPRFLRKRYRLLLPLFPIATEMLNLREYDLVISSSGAWSKGIVTRLNTLHLAYIHSPMRYVWDAHEEYLKVLKKKRNILLRGLLSYLRIWDFEAAQRPEVLVANSRYTQARIQKYYRRAANIIYPPLGQDFFSATMVPLAERKPYFLLVSRITKIKRVDLVVETFNKLGFELVIVGEGSERRRLERMASPHISFRGFISDEALIELYRHAEALLFPSEEDFGLAAAEAHAVGTPVIAYEHGGVREIVVPGVTGEVYTAQRGEIIAETILRFQKHKGDYNQALMRERVQMCTRAGFREKMQEEVRRLLEV